MTGYRDSFKTRNQLTDLNEAEGNCPDLFLSGPANRRINQKKVESYYEEGRSTPAGSRELNGD
ncbi:MAG: hypothetical protein DME99_07280 [Verrucomicrobia bacterium]|nr:MAG: hypothetical protein DME99_07280 [Verrucomicrobiota bacterium]